MTERAYAPRALAVYFQDVAAQRLLTAAEEVRLAEEIESQDIRVWELLLSYAPAVPYIVSLLESSLENSLAEFRTLRTIAQAVRETRRKAEKQQLAACARVVAGQLRSLDLDRQHRDFVVADLRRLARGEPQALHGRRARLPFGPRSQSFADYLAAVERAMVASDRVRAEFVEANLRLVLAVARKYDLGAMPFDDLIQEGNLGLIKAVDRFDHRRGLRFSTYATWWIRHNVGRAIAEKSRTIRLPVHIVDSKQRIARVQRTLSSSLGRKPTTEEVAEAAALSPAKVDDVAGRLPQYRVSLDEPIGHDIERPRLEVFRDPQDEQTSPFDELCSKRTCKLVRQLLDRLRPVEADIIRQRFGIGDDQERTLQEIADQYGLSRERIRQIQEEAIAKLRRAMKTIDRA